MLHAPVDLLMSDECRCGQTFLVEMSENGTKALICPTLLNEGIDALADGEDWRPTLEVHDAAAFLVTEDN